MSKPKPDNDNGRVFHIRLNKSDRERLELISSLFDVSLSVAIRVSIKAASQKLGIERELSNILEASP